MERSKWPHFRYDGLPIAASCGRTHELLNPIRVALCGAQSNKTKIPPLCRGGSGTLRMPEGFSRCQVCFGEAYYLAIMLLFWLFLLFTGCDHVPLWGQQPKASISAGGSLLNTKCLVGIALSCPLSMTGIDGSSTSSANNSRGACDDQILRETEGDVENISG
jgi:hypothetical protein